MSRPAVSLRNRIAIALLGMALALRVLVPAGWMPTTGQDGGFAVTICNGVSMESAWIDADGKIHKQKPAQGGDQHCAFAGLGLPMLGGDPVPEIAPALTTTVAPLPARLMASISRGLAAPPPPATGPPATV